MKLSSAFSLILCALFACLTYAQSCNRVGVRKAFHRLSSAERQAFLGALRDYFADNEAAGHPNRWDRMGQMHYDLQHVIHNGAVFLPWHRYFIRQFELELQRYNPSVFLPYWDWPVDYRNPSASVLFSDTNFGGDGDSDGCVSSGPMSDLEVAFDLLARRRNICMQRRFDARYIERWYAPEFLDEMVENARTYSDLENRIEHGGYHAIVHYGIGGHMGTSLSPFDILFFLHHAKVDQVWASWQRRWPQRAHQYNGLNTDRSPADDTDALPGYRAVTVADTMRTQDYCYTYGAYIGGTPELQKRSISLAADLVPDSSLTISADATSMVGLHVSTVSGTTHDVEDEEERQHKLYDSRNFNFGDYQSPVVSEPLLLPNTIREEDIHRFMLDRKKVRYYEAYHASLAKKINHDNGFDIEATEEQSMEDKAEKKDMKERSHVVCHRKPKHHH